MSQERKYEVGDRVRVSDAKCHSYGKFATVKAIDPDPEAKLVYLLEFGNTRGWYEEPELTRAPSSPDEQDTDNAGGSEPYPKGITTAEDIYKILDRNKKPEAVEHPAHYGGDTPYEVIKVAEAWGLDKDAYLFNVLKYVGRSGKKDAEVQDLRKAAFYLQRKIDRLTK